MKFWCVTEKDCGRKCITADFVLLTSSCHVLHHLCNVLRRSCDSSSECANNTRSSAYIKTGIFLSPIRIPTPVCVNVSAKSFINRLNSRGDKIHPCFKPADTFNQFEYCALIRRRLSVPLYIALIDWYMFLLTPYSLNLYQSIDLLTQSRFS